MTALLAAQTAIVLGHIFVDILIANGGLGIANAAGVKSLVKTKVTHNSGHHGVAFQLPLGLHILAQHIENMVAGDNIAVFIHTEAAVGVAIVGKANIQAVIHNELLQHLNVGGTGVVVDVDAVGLIVDHISLCAQGFEYQPGNVPGGAVGAIQAHFYALEGIHSQADQVANVSVTAGHIVHSAADGILLCVGQGGPLLAKEIQFSVKVGFHQFDGGFFHLFAVAVDEFDAVIVVRIVAGGDHHTAVEIIHPGHIGHGGGGGDVEQISVCAGSGKTGGQSVLKHITGAAGVLADDHLCPLIIAGSLPELIVVPAQKTAYLEGMVSGQIHIGFSTETVSTKIFTHKGELLSLNTKHVIPTKAEPRGGIRSLILRRGVDPSASLRSAQDDKTMRFSTDIQISQNISQTEHPVRLCL